MCIRDSNTRPSRVDMSPTTENKTLPSRPSLNRMGSSQHVLVSKQESVQSGNSQASSGSGRQILHATPLLIASGRSQLWGKDGDEGVFSSHCFLLLHRFCCCQRCGVIVRGSVLVLCQGGSGAALVIFTAVVESLAV